MTSLSGRMGQRQHQVLLLLSLLLVAPGAAFTYAADQAAETVANGQPTPAQPETVPLVRARQ
jgi:hypothetical protein